MSLFNVIAGPWVVTPIKSPAPAYFNLTVAPRSVTAGGTASLTVVIRLNDKPVSGATVKLAMLFSPGGDYRFSPGSGTTNQDGVFAATVKTSRNPGESVIAATSGVFSDQGQVQGTGAASSAASTPVKAAARGGLALIPVVGLMVLGLVTAGFYLRLRYARGRAMAA